MRPPLPRPPGFTLVEMMVALAIGMIVMLGFAVSFVSLKGTYNAQNQISQLQDNERLALAMLTSTVNEAGYYPTPWLQSQATALGTAPTDPYGAQMPTGASVYGTTATASVPETLSIAYVSASGDGVLSCQGGTNTTGNQLAIRNVFYVDPAVAAFGCRVWAGASDTTAPGNAFVPLVNGVQSMHVLYGVAASALPGSSVNQYQVAANVGNWSLVKSVRIQLVFSNPTTPGSTITWWHTINLMNNS